MNTARPTNPADISFDRSCFAQDGTTIYWTVSRSALHSGPRRFDSEVEALAYAKRCDRPVTRHEVPKMVRISWQ